MPGVGEDQCPDRERARHHEQADGLGRLVESQVALARDLEPIVDRPHDAGTDDATHHEDAASREDATKDVADQPAGGRRDHDGDTAHGRRAGLGLVAGGAVLANRLADPVAGEPTNEKP